MPSLSEYRRMVAEALREVRRRERAADSSIERMERRIFALLDRKTLIDEEDAIQLYERYFKEFHNLVKDLERGLVDFYGVVSVGYGRRG